MSNTDVIIARAMPELEPTGDGWTVGGLAVPCGRSTLVTNDGVTSYLEEFAPGCFERDAAVGGRWVRLLAGHGSDYAAQYLGRCLTLVEQPDGLHAEFRLERDHPLAEQARAGELTGWSVSARIVRSRTRPGPDGPVTVRQAGTLDHVAATTRPQYTGAGVLTVRAAPEPPATPRLDALRAFLAGRG